MKNTILGIALILFCFPICAEAINGIVSDKESKTSIPYVSIGIINSHVGTYSSDSGLFELTLNEYKDNDSIRFSCIGYFPKTYRLIDFLEKFTHDSDTVFLTKKVTELNEVVISGKRLKKKKLGNKTSHKKIAFSCRKDLEGGILIENDNKLFLNKVSFKLTMDGKQPPDSAIFRFNIYNMKGKLPDQNILTRPIYFHLSKDQFNGTNEFDISKYNVTIDKDFAATIEIIKQYGGGLIYFAGWINGCPSVHRVGTQGKWFEARADKKNGRDGMKLHQSLEIEVLIEDLD